MSEKTFASAGYVQIPSGPVRALLNVKDRLFAVVGNRFCEVYPEGEWNLRGIVRVFHEQPATLTSNGTTGNQIFIASGGCGYVFDMQTNELREITADVTHTPLGWKSAIALGAAAIVASPRKLSRRVFMCLGWKS